MSKKLQALGFLAVMFAVYIRQLPPSPITPVVYPDPLPTPLTANSLLSNSERVWKGGVMKGPEHFAVDAEGRYMYTGLADGRIIRIRVGEPRATPETLLFVGDPQRALPLPCGQYDTEPICGRPLGLAVDNKRNRLIVADAYHGLLAVNLTNFKIEWLTREVTQLKKNDTGSKRILFPNSVALNEKNGVIYFTDSSARFQRRDVLYDMLEGGSTGRILSYDPTSKKTSVVVNDLYFPNGLVLSNDGESLVFAETSRYRLRRYWLKGDKKGTLEMFADALPGIPDNLSVSSDKKSIWVGCGSLRTAFTKLMGDYPEIRKWLARVVPQRFIWNVVPAYGLLLRVDANTGAVLETLQDGSGRVTWSSSAVEHNGYLFIGSVRDEIEWISRYSLPGVEHSPAQHVASVRAQAENVMVVNGASPESE